MLPRSIVAVFLSFGLPATSVAQHDGSPPAAPSPPAEAKQFDFLVGQWDLVVTPTAKGLAQKVHGVPKLLGSWKAWRALDGFGVEDELRIIDESGNPRALSHAVRFYDGSAHHWSASTLDVYRGSFGASTAEWRDGSMTALSRSVDAEGHASQARSRFYDITPASFTFQQERSTDEGRSWATTVTIRAKRVAAAAPR